MSGPVFTRIYLSLTSFNTGRRNNFPIVQPLESSMKLSKTHRLATVSILSALSLAATAAPDLILVDINLPGLDKAVAQDLVAHCREVLAHYKVPREIRFEEIPKTSTGKIQKFQLRERAKSSSAIE